MRQATKSSLVIIDELGRGTTTYDGMAIASAVLNEMASSCRIIFSTHFHQLTRDYDSDSRVSTYHMAYVETGEKELTFLYKLRSGACPKSHGFNTARLAGLPPHVIELGEKFSENFEKQEKLKQRLVELYSTTAY